MLTLLLYICILKIYFYLQEKYPQNTITKFELSNPSYLGRNHVIISKSIYSIWVANSECANLNFWKWQKLYNISVGWVE